MYKIWSPSQVQLGLMPVHAKMKLEGSYIPVQVHSQPLKVERPFKQPRSCRTAFAWSSTGSHA